MTDNLKLIQWQKELDRACDEAGLTLQDICDYLSLSYNRDVGFYVKIPMKRKMFIGIGMALGCPLETINSWIMRFGNKRKLYSKDVSEDLIWIYLIRCNIEDFKSFKMHLKQKSANTQAYVNAALHAGDAHNSDSERDKMSNPDNALEPADNSLTVNSPYARRNYFFEYEKCQELAFETYLSVWTEVITGAHDTSDVDRDLETIGEGGDYEDLKSFVLDNIQSFNTAYSKPRKMLAKYCESILATNAKSGESARRGSLISLRGWLDDSMINYLSGSPGTINVTDRKSGKRKSDIKKIPKSRRSHIALALALGMCRSEVDQYLELMGYRMLDEDDPGERILISELDRWEQEHPQQTLYKEKYIHKKKIDLDEDTEQQAVTDMLMLRQDLRARYKLRKKKFDYMRL